MRMNAKPRGLTKISDVSPYFLKRSRISSSFISLVMLPMKRRLRPVNFFFSTGVMTGGPMCRTMPPWCCPP